MAYNYSDFFTNDDLIVISEDIFNEIVSGTNVYYKELYMKTIKDVDLAFERLEKDYLKDLNTAIVYIKSGSDLTLYDQTIIVEKVRSNLSDDAQIIYGVGINKDKEGIVVTVLASRK